MYASLNDESLVIEAILYRVDKHFGGIFGKMASIFSNILPAALCFILGVSYDSITSLNKEVLEQCWDLYCRKIEITSAIVNFVFLSMIVAFINYTELQTRRHAIEYHFEARGLKNRLYNQTIEAKK